MQQQRPLRRIVEGALAGGGTRADGAAAEKLARLGGRKLGHKQREQYSQAIHWGLGAAAGAVYALLRERLPASAAGASAPVRHRVLAGG